MSQTPTSRDDGFAALWPWTGNVFLLLFAAWCFYMGWMAVVEDLTRAFYGLGGVTVLVLALGLRAAVAGTVRGRPASEPAPHEGEGAGERAGMVPGAQQPAAPSLTAREATADRIAQLEARINRERAERGAQVTRLDTAVSELGGTIAGRLAALEETLSALPPERFGKDDGPRPQEQSGEGEIDGTTGLGDRVAALKAELDDAKATIRAELAALVAGREADAREIAELRASLAAAGAGAPEEGGPTAEGTDALSRRIEAAVAQSIAARDGETRRAIEEMRRNLEAVTSHAARMGENYRALLRRVEEEGATEPASDTATPADVETLRDALTTIIAQNREIRAQQDLLTARFDKPTRVELDTHPRRTGED